MRAWIIPALLFIALAPYVSADLPSSYDLRDVTGQTGIDFVHTHCGTGGRYIMESMTAGLATFDFDGDGWIDVYLLNGAPLDGDTAEPAPLDPITVTAEIADSTSVTLYYVIDFGTESGRAVLVETKTGKEVAAVIYSYKNAVIDETLPVKGEPVKLDPEWALQDPQDYIRTFQKTIPAVLAKAGVNSEDVIGIGIDFTACTMLPVKSDGTALCSLPEFESNPHAWVKLWKHHAAQPEADKINTIARQRGEKWLNRYGGKISSEWFFAKALQILNEAPEIYAAADR